MEIDKLISYINMSKKQYFLVEPVYLLLVVYKTLEVVMDYTKKKESIHQKRFYLITSL